MTRAETRRRTLPGWIIAIGDAAAIVLFVVIGLISHDDGVTISGVARTALPTLGAWFAVAALIGTYARPGFRTMLATWAIAVPIAVSVRGLILHRAADGSQVVFGIVQLTVTLVLFTVWRFVAAGLARVRAS